MSRCTKESKYRRKSSPQKVSKNRLHRTFPHNRKWNNLANKFDNSCFLNPNSVHHRHTPQSIPRQNKKLKPAACKRRTHKALDYSGYPHNPNCNCRDFREEER